jgi:hypothetical protein
MTVDLNKKYLKLAMIAVVCLIISYTANENVPISSDPHSHGLFWWSVVSFFSGIGAFASFVAAAIGWLTNDFGEMNDPRL